MKPDKLSDSIRFLDQEGGPRLGWSEASGVGIVTQDGLHFKNLSRSGKLEPFEDWRLAQEARAEDLARRLTVRQIAGLMMNGGFMEFPSADPDGPEPWEVTERYQHVFRDLGIRHLIIGTTDTVENMVRLNNNRQAFIEALDLPIPLNACSDPRHGADNNSEFNQGAGATVSQWTEMLGLAATFDPDLVRRHGEIAAREYRALGITTALSPQLDLATEPRWNRVKGTFGEGAKLVADMGRAYIEGFQTSDGGGWGQTSVMTICKHWPGGGTGEAGRDAHHASGKYAVYPGNNFDLQLQPFLNGAFSQETETSRAAGVMPYYTIPFGIAPDGSNVGNAYNRYIIRDLLRKRFGYDGLICTDWEIVKLPEARKELNFGIFWQKRCWGMENVSPQEQCYQLLMNGVDQFGGDNDIYTLLEGYELGRRRHGEAFMEDLLRRSAVRILTNTFRLGLFENPYLDMGESKQIVACETFRRAGLEAQEKSVVLLKNRKQALPLLKRTALYIPCRQVDRQVSWRGEEIPAHEEDPLQQEALEGFFRRTDRPEEAAAAVVFIQSPQTQSGNPMEETPGVFEPISLQYRPYTASSAREKSIAGDDPNGTGPNRSYRGKTVRTINEKDLDLVLETRKKMGDKPVIVVAACTGPFVLEELEPSADAILIHFGVLPQTLLKLLSGEREPSGLLPMQFPANMETVETQCEDVPFDMACHVDTEGSCYDYAFGMNWSGRIRDWRTERYGR